MTAASASSARIRTGTSSTLATWKIASSMSWVVSGEVHGHVGDGATAGRSAAGGRGRPAAASAQLTPRARPRRTMTSQRTRQARTRPSAGRLADRRRRRRGGRSDVDERAGAGRQRGHVADQSAGHEPGRPARPEGSARAGWRARPRPRPRPGRATAGGGGRRGGVGPGGGARGGRSSWWCSRPAQSSSGQPG